MAGIYGKRLSRCCIGDESLNLKQKAQIYCIKHGHADFISTFFGYVYCGRCGEQIGDQLAGIFDTTDKILVNHKCEKCKKAKRKLSALDKKILNKLERTKNKFYDYEKILKGVPK